MPEGDTIHRTAQALRVALTGHRISCVQAWHEHIGMQSLSGRIFNDVEARGKHLLIHLDDGQSIQSHMGMTGSWHLYRPGQSWRKPQQRAALVLHTEELLAVCFTPKTLEVLDAGQLRRHSYLLVAKCYSCI